MRRPQASSLFAIVFGSAWLAGAGLTPCLAQITSRASVGTTGTESDDFSFRAAISADGRYVAFHSRASNLVVGDANDEDDVFVHDNYAGVTILVSVSSSGAITSPSTPVIVKLSTTLICSSRSSSRCGPFQMT